MDQAASNGCTGNSGPGTEAETEAVSASEATTTTTGGNPDVDVARSLCSSKVNETLSLIQSEDLELQLEAAMEIRRLTKTSQRYRRHFSKAVEPLVGMLRYSSVQANEAALLALLNLAVKDEK